MKIIYSFRQQDRVTKKQDYISKELRYRILNLIDKYNSEYLEDLKQKALDELKIYYPIKCFNENNEFVETYFLSDFISSTKPAYVLDYIEIFYSLLKNKNFENDINMFFIYEKVDYRLVNGEIILSKIKIPKIENQSLDELMGEIERDIREGNFKLVTDRLNTYSSFMIKDLCEKRDIKIKKNGDGYIDIAATYKEILEYFNCNNVLTNFSYKSLKRAGELWSDFYNIRNNCSYAHPNKVLESSEAEYVVATVCAMLNYIHNLDMEIK